MSTEPVLPRKRKKSAGLKEVVIFAFGAFAGIWADNPAVGHLIRELLNLL